MQVFPNLYKICLEAETVPPLSADGAIQFLRYLLRISYLRIDDIPLENSEQVLMEFYNKK